MKKLYVGRVLMLLLCLALMIGVFAACNTAEPPADTTGAPEQPTDTTGGGSDETTGSGGVTPPETVESSSVKTEIAVSDYVVCIPESSSNGNEEAAAKQLSDAVKENLGAEFGKSDAGAEGDASAIDPNAYEILIGATSRPESAAALEKLGGKSGYVIVRIGNKIAINASSSALLDEAVAFFVDTYVVGGTSGILTIPETFTYIKSDFSGISLLDSDGKLAYDIVHSASLDTTAGADKYDRVDYIMLYINYLLGGDADRGITGLSKLLGAEGLAAKTDNSAPSGDRGEILLGRTNRPETEAFLSGLAINEYGYAIVGNKLVAVGWSDYTTALAIEMLARDIDSYLSKEGGVNVLTIPEAGSTVKAYDKWVVDVPLYNAGTLTNVVEYYNDCYQAYYTDTTVDAYNAYCADLVATKGYRIHQQNQIGDNVYGTFTNGEAVIHVYFVDYLKAVRFFAQPAASTILPQNEDIEFEKITDMSFTAFDFDTAKGNWGNCFIITLEDGSFILHDGGGTEGGTGDPEELYKLLDRLNAREDGRIIIAGWIISHQHYDHFMNAYTMVQNHQKDVEIERMIFNVPTDSVDYNSRNPNHYYQGSHFTNIQSWTGADLVMLRSGQTIKIRNITLEVVYSIDDVYPRALEKFNNSAFVTRFDVGEGADKQRVMILGDAEEVACETMVELHGDALKCDIVTVAHHGSGGSIDLYAHCKPKIVIWPGPQTRADGDLKASNKGYYGTINKSLCNQPNVLLLVVADYGHRKIDLPLLGLSDNRASNEANMENYVLILKRADGLAY